MASTSCFSMMHSSASSQGRSVLARCPHHTPRHNLHFLFLLRLETPFVTWSPTNPADSFGWRQVWERNYSFNACCKFEKLAFGLASFWFLRLTLPHLHILSAIWTMPSCFIDSHYPAVKPCQLSLALFQCLCSEVCSICCGLPIQCS